MSTFWLIVLTSLFTLMWHDLIELWMKRRKRRREGTRRTKWGEPIGRVISVEETDSGLVVKGKLDEGFRLEGLNMSDPKNNALIRDYLEWKENRDRNAHSQKNP